MEYLSADATKIRVLNNHWAAISEAVRLLAYEPPRWFWDRYKSTTTILQRSREGIDQRLVFSGAKIVGNLVRRANRDQHGPRTFEIPACGGFMLTERTDDQRSFLAEDKEAAYFCSDRGNG